jgi:hypothetical protein
MIEESESSSEIPPVENEEPSPVIPDTGCSSLVDKYTDLLLTDKQKKEISDRTNFYYSMKQKSLKKVGFCVLCNKRFASNTNKKTSQFITEYDDTTYCRTLEIFCFADHPCKGWKLVYGVVFNLEEMIQQHKKQIEELKRAIIINKNDLMFGYKARKDAIELHETLIAQLEGIMETYSTRLYKYLSYANNNRMNEDIDKINKHITLLTEDIKGFVAQEKIREAVEASLAIKSDYVCMKNLKQLQENSYREFLFNCQSQFVEDEEMSIKENKKASKEKEVIEKTQKKKKKEMEKEVEEGEEKKEKNKKKKIEQELNHLFMTFDIIDELLDADPDFLDQISKEIKKLKLMIKKHGTEEQVGEFKTIEDLFATKFSEVENKKRDREKEEHDKMEQLLSGENDENLKQQMEEEMEELS